MSAKRTSKRTLETRKAGKTDWARVDSLTEEQIEANAATDEENGLWTEEQLKAARLVLPEDRTRCRFTSRLDPEVLEYFKSQGPGIRRRSMQFSEVTFAVCRPVDGSQPNNTSPERIRGGDQAGNGTQP